MNFWQAMLFWLLTGLLSLGIVFAAIWLEVIPAPRAIGHKDVELLVGVVLFAIVMGWICKE